MSDWQVGDLALCVKPSVLATNPAQPGACYQVSGVFLWCGPNGEVVGLLLNEIPNTGPGWRGHAAQRFIKVTPEEADEFDRETIALLTGTPVIA